MSKPLRQKVGPALSWKAVQHIGVKLIFMIRLVVLAWILSPDDFGLLAIASVAIDFLLRVTNVGMAPALVQHPDTRQAHYDLAWTINFLRGLAIAIIVFAAAPQIAGFMQEPRAIPLIRVLALRPLLQGLVSIKIAALTRDLRFRELALIDLPDAIVNTVVAIALAPTLGVWGLIAGGLAGPAVNLILSYVMAPYRPRLSFDRTSAQTLIRFGRWVFVVSLLSVMGSSLQRVLISRQLGAAELGLYYLAASLAFLPGELASEVAGAVAFPLFARLQDNAARMAEAFRAMLTVLAALIFPMCAVLIVLAPSIVMHILSPRWQGSAPLIQLLACVNVIGLLGDTIMPIFYGAGRPASVALVEAIQSGVLIVMVYLLTTPYGVAGAAFAWLPAVAVSQLASLYLLRQVLTIPGRGLVGPLVVVTAAAALIALLAAAIDGAIGGLSGLILGSAAAGVFWLILSWGGLRYFPIRFVQEILSDVSRPDRVPAVGLHPEGI